MLIKHFTLTFVALAASVNALVIPLHSRRADDVAAANGSNDASVAENNAPKIVLPPPPVPNIAAPDSPPPSPPSSVASNTNPSSQQSETSFPQAPAANDAQTTIPAAVDMPTSSNSQTTTKHTPTDDITVQTTKAATGTPEANDVQSTISNKDATDAHNSPAAQSAKDLPTANNNNTPAPLATIPDTPSSNDIQSQSQFNAPIINNVQPQSPDTEAAKSTTVQTTPTVGPAAQVISKPEDVPHAMAAPSPPFTAEPETAQANPPGHQVASEPQVGTVPTPGSMAEEQLQGAFEPKIPPSLQSTQETTDDDSDSQSTSAEAAKPKPQPAPAKNENPEPQAASAEEAKPEPKPATAGEAKPEPQAASADRVKPESQPASAVVAKPEVQPAPVKEAKPDSQPAAGNGAKSDLNPAPAEEPKPETKPELQPASAAEAKPRPQVTPVGEEHSDFLDEADTEVKPKPASAPAVETMPEPKPAPVKEPKPEPLHAPVDEAEPISQPALVTQPNSASGTPTVLTNSIECLVLLMKTQQPLTRACQNSIRDDPTLVQIARLDTVNLDFMYSGKDFPVISSQGLRLKLQEIPGYTLSVDEARYDVTINYKDHDTVSFSPPWTPSTMQGSTLITAIDQVDVNVLSSNAFTDLITAMLTKPKTPVILKGTVDINLSIASADGGTPKTVIIAGLQFSSPMHMPGLNGLSQKSFVRSDGYLVYGNTFYFSSVFKFMSPSNLKLTMGSVEFDVLDSAGKKLATSAIDLFEIAPEDNEVSIRLISKVDDSAAFLNLLHYTGDTVTIQGRPESSDNAYLGVALSQLNFTLTYPAVADVPPQNAPVAVDTPLPVPPTAADIPPKSPVAATPWF
ncbi:hypothetical protein BGZ47_010879 [Haplosporangium gracile]|nr:hypothetical protein BGZ47_010879 [Haplosporangium gracile]